MKFNIHYFQSSPGVKHMKLCTYVNYCFFSFIAFYSSLSFSGVCADGKDADGLKRAGEKGFCMAIETFSPKSVKEKTPLIVVLHGDNRGQMSGSSYQALATSLGNTFDSPSIFMLRPGYKSDKGKSDGYAKYEDDDYTSQNMEYLSFALNHLRSTYLGRALILVGHSGGAASAAILAAKYPKLVDAAILAGCPCDITPWRDWRNQSAGKRGSWSSLSPLDFVKQTNKDAFVIAVTGDKDTNTLPKFAEVYIQGLISNGIENASFILAKDATHQTVRTSPELSNAVRSAIEYLGKAK